MNTINHSYFLYVLDGGGVYQNRYSSSFQGVLFVFLFEGKTDFRLDEKRFEIDDAVNRTSGVNTLITIAFDGLFIKKIFVIPP